MSFLREGVDEYIKRLAPYVSISITELGELKKVISFRIMND